MICDRYAAPDRSLNDAGNDKQACLCPSERRCVGVVPHARSRGTHRGGYNLLTFSSLIVIFSDSQLATRTVSRNTAFRPAVSVRAHFPTVLGAQQLIRGAAMWNPSTDINHRSRANDVTQHKRSAISRRPRALSLGRKKSFRTAEAMVTNGKRPFNGDRKQPIRYSIASFRESEHPDATAVRLNYVQ